MSALISKEQARQITGGRLPHIPVEYETAVNSLQACLTLDEAKYWSNAADAFTAWAKMYRSGDALRKAKMLKLHAFRRMGQLAEEINPRLVKQGVGVGKGSVAGSGPRSILKQHGFSAAEVDAARMLADVSERTFTRLLKNPMSPTTARARLRDITIWHHTQAALMTLRSRCRVHTPAQTIITMSVVERANARELVREVVEWLDEFDQRLKP
jgi:hypothetical protein